MRLVRTFIAALSLVSLVSSTASAQLGTLVHDGPPTPEQISLYIPVTGTLTATVASVRYRPTAGSQWSVAHPLHRIRPSFAVATVADAFAGVITGLSPGTSYTVEVTVPLGTSSSVQTIVASTRALPGPSPAPNRTVAAGSTGSQIQAALDALLPGDVLQLANGTYSVEDLRLNRSGTDSQPVTVRGASRNGVVLRDPTGRVLHLLDASHVILEDLTLEGSGTDSGTDASSEGVRFWSGEAQRNVTIRRVTMRGVDKGVVADHRLEQILVYDCTLTGNNVWTQSFLETNLTWNDDGIRLPGAGNAAFHNTLFGFGDALAMSDGVENASVHFYRNDIRMTGDDAFEGDYGYRNLTFYDNRVHNSMTLVSFDPIHGGPAFVFRNIAINTGRGPFKFNNENTGHFVYNNTIVRTNGYRSGANWGWIQYDNGAQRAWGYRNNLLIYQGAGNLFAMEADGQDPIDFTNNAWFPDAAVWWSTTGGSFSSLADARSGLAPTTPVFGTSTQRHQNDLICEADPFAQDIVLGSSYLTFVTTLSTPTLAAGSVAREAGVAIPGITDGFTGTAPDVGAIQSGVPPPLWGDRDTGAPADTVAPAAVTNLRAE